MKYMDRLKISLLISFFIHLLLIFLLPGVPPYEPDMDPGSKMKITLAYQSQGQFASPEEELISPEETESRESEPESEEEPVETDKESEPEREPQKEEVVEPEDELLESSDEEETVSPEDKTEETQQQRSEFLSRDGLLTGSSRVGDEQPEDNSRRQTRGLQFANRRYLARSGKTGDTDTTTAGVRRLLDRVKIDTELLDRAVRDTDAEVTFDDFPDFTAVVIDEDFAEAETYLQPRSMLRESVSRPLPEMPGWLEEKGEEVRIMVEYWINREGYIEEMSILQSSGHRALDREVLNTMSRWRYTPGAEIVRQVAVFHFVLST
ncbi:MAG: energy transducer TonB [bacterium]